MAFSKLVLPYRRIYQDLIPRFHTSLLASRSSCNDANFGWMSRSKKLNSDGIDNSCSEDIANNKHPSNPHQRRPFSMNSQNLNKDTTSNRNISHSVNSLQEKEIIFKSPFPDLEIPHDIQLSHYILNEMLKYGNATALIDGVTGEEYSYAKLRDMIVRVSSGLVRMGVRKGDIITIYSPNCMEYMVIAMAINAVGAVFSGVNPAYNSGELKHALQLVNSRILVTVPALLVESRRALETCPSVQEIILFGEGSKGCRPFSSLLEDDMSKFPENIDIIPGNDLASIPFSSGTTGLPKGVMLTHRNLLSNIIQNRQRNVLDYQAGQDRLLCILPLFHIYGKVIIMMAGLASGATIVTLPKFDPEIFLSSIQKHKITFLNVVPPMLLFLAKHPMVDKYDLSSISRMFVGAAPCSSDTIELLLAKLKQNVLIRQGYGMTETSPTTHVNPPNLNKYHTVGPSIQNTEFKVVDIENGKSLPSGESGELHVRGPQVMKGYFKNKEASDDALSSGWLRTGDIGFADEDGYVTLVDRLKEFIKVKGYQVAPAELEAILVSHPAVLDAAVVGRPDEKLGEAPTAFVVLKPHMKVTTDQLHRLVADRVAPFKRLAGGIEFRSEIPKSPTGKILRRVLKAELLQKN